MSKDAIITVRMSGELHRQIKEAASLQCCSMNQLCIDAIATYIETEVLQDGQPPRQATDEDTGREDCSSSQPDTNGHSGGEGCPSGAF